MRWIFFVEIGASVARLLFFSVVSKAENSVAELSAALFCVAEIDTTSKSWIDKKQSKATDWAHARTHPFSLPKVRD